MSEDSPNSLQTGVIHTIRWSEICPWIILFRAARAALLARVMLLALVGAVVTQWGWAAVDGAFRHERVTPFSRIVLTDPAERHVELPLETATSGRPWDVATVSASASRLAEQTYAGPLARGWAWLSQPALRQLESDGWRQWTRAVLAGVWAIAVWTLLGGAIARIAALYLTRSEKIGPLEALRAAAKNWSGFAGAPVAAYCGILVFVLPLLATGFAMRLSLVAFASSLLWFIALVLGAMALVLTIGALVGWPLMWAAAAVERSDPFDAVSRAYAYVLQRPFHLLFFVAIASVLGLGCQAVVSFGADGVVWMTERSVASGLGGETAPQLFATDVSAGQSDVGLLDRGANRLIGGWSSLVLGVASAFPLAYLFSAATGIYLLLRQLVDSTEMDEVSIDEAVESDPLPPLAMDPKTNVPQVVKDGNHSRPDELSEQSDQPDSENDDQ